MIPRDWLFYALCASILWIFGGIAYLYMTREVVMEPESEFDKTRAQVAKLRRELHFHGHAMTAGERRAKYAEIDSLEFDIWTFLSGDRT